MSLSRLLTRCLACVILLLLAATPLALANTIHVPADQPTIQAGINAASNGDTVLVAPGTYYENINFNGKAITVTSSAGAKTTILDGSYLDLAVVTLGNPGGQPTVLNGFTIQHGESVNLGAVNAFGAAIITNNLIIGNSTCGIMLDGDTTVVRGNTVASNQGAYHQNYPGETVCWLSATGIMANGGSYYHGSTYITSNTTIDSNLVESNDGTGIQIFNQAKALVSNNTITGNASKDDTVGVDFGGSGTIFLQNLIYANGGVGFYTNGQTGSILYNNTIAGNGVGNPSLYGGAYPSSDVYTGLGDGIFAINNLIVGTNSSLPALSCINYANSGWFDHNDIVSLNFNSPVTANCHADQGTSGNISVDPRFVNSANGDFHLLAGSKAIDSGNNSGYQTPLQDLDGNPRIQNATSNGCTIDMGAYEYPGQSLCNTTETLTSSINPALFTEPVTFTAQLSSSNGTPTGAVEFLDGTSILSTQTVSASGAAAFTTSALAIGTHTITASFQPSGTFGTNSATLTQVVNPYPTTSTLTCSPSTVVIGQPFTLVFSATSSNGTPTGSVTIIDSGNPFATLPLTNGSAANTTSAIAIGTHTFLATYVPTGSFAGSTATCTATVTGAPTTTTLTTSLNPSNWGQSVTFTAATTINASSSIPTGSITFFNGSSALATVPLDSTGHASTSTGALAPGTDSISAVYSGSTSLAASTSATLSEVVVAPATSISLLTSPNPSVAFQAIQLAAQVSIPTTNTPSVTLQGIVTYTAVNASGTTIPLGSAPLFSNGSASLSTPSLGAGTYTITASFSGTATYSGTTIPLTGTSSPATQVVNPVPTTLALAASPSAPVYFQGFFLTATLNDAPSTALPVGSTITFTEPSTNGNLGSAPLSATGTAQVPVLSQLSAGTHSLVATFAGNANFGASSATLTVTIGRGTSNLVLSATPSAVQLGQPVNFTANLTPAGYPTGLITITEPSTNAVIGQLTASLHHNLSSLTVTNLSVGTHQLLATYSGDNNWLPSQSALVTVTVIQQDFALAFSPPTLTLETLHAASAPFTLTSIGSLADTLDLTCTNLPADTTCTLATPNMTLTPGQTLTSSVSIDTRILPVAAVTRPPSPFRRIPPAAWAALLPLTLVLLRRRSPRTRIHLLATLILTLAAVNTLTGCTWLGYAPPHTPPGTYTLTLTATGRTTGITHSTPLTLTVTP